jgi:NAD(P)H dehydrogenase (quinone)
MYAIIGITGQVGGAVAEALLAQRLPVRALVRDARKGAVWAARGCEVAVADLLDSTALTAALRGTEGAFVMLPPAFDPLPGFPELGKILAALKPALERARPGKIVALSSIGAQATQPNLLTQLGLFEQALSGLPMPVAFLRPAWFIENAAWDVAPARERGVIPSFLAPLDRPVPMVATADIGQVAAELLRDSWSGRRIVELEGPARVTPNQIAAAFARILGRPVRMEAVPRSTWESVFRSQGMQNPAPRIAMLDGFNEGWIEFESGEAASRKGLTDLATAIAGLVERASPPVESSPPELHHS